MASRVFYFKVYNAQVVSEVLEVLGLHQATEEATEEVTEATEAQESTEALEAQQAQVVWRNDSVKEDREERTKHEKVRINQVFLCIFI